MLFAEVDVVDLWRDFTTQTKTEVSMNSLEFVFGKFMADSNGKAKETIDFPLPEDGSTVKLTVTFYPAGYTKAKRMEDVFDITLSYPDIIRTLFHVSGPFVVIRGADGFRIKDSSARRIVSFGVPSAVSVGFEYPVFVNIPLKAFLHYIGFQYSESGVTHFASQSHYWDDNLVSTFPEMRAAFARGFDTPKDVHFSGRQILSIDRSDFSAAATHRRVCFYSKVDQDPLKKLGLFFQWDKRNTEQAPLPSNASELVIIPEMKQNPSHHTLLRSFIKRYNSMKENDTFSVWITPDVITPDIKTAVEKLFSSESRDVLGHVVLKSAPVGSILSDLAVLIVHHKFVKNFAAIWTYFVKKIRECSEKRVKLSRIVCEKVSFEYCLIYQKLQLFNLCIEMLHGKDKTFVQCEDQYDLSKQFYEQTKEYKYLLECWSTWKAHFGENLEEFEKLFGKIEDPTCEIDFDPALQIEMIVDYLECMKPTEVFDQLILVLVETALHDIENRALLEVPMSKEAFENIQNKVQDFKNGNCEIDDLCKTFEQSTLNIEIVSSALAKIPSAAAVNEMLTKGFVVVRRTSDDVSVSPLVDALNLDLRAQNFIQREDYVFTGESDINDHDLQYMFVSKQSESACDKYVVATAIRESVKQFM